MCRTIFEDYMTNFIKSLFYSRKANVKKYKFLGLTIVKIRKLPYKKSVKIFNLVKFSNKVKYKFSLKQIISFYFNRIWGKIIYKKQIKQNKKTKILICLHMFYPQSWKLITKYLHNLDSYDYDLLITYTKGNFSADEVALMSNFKYGTKVVEYENKGFDVGPFIDCLNNVDLTKYDIVLKLHSKGITRKFIFIYNQIFKYKDWFFNLFNGVLGGKAVHILVDKLLNDSKIGIVAAENLIVHDPKHKRFFTSEHIKNTNINILSDYRYVAGTCFAIKASLLQKFKQYHFTIDNFAVSERRCFSFAHAMERVICAFIEPLGYEFHGIKTKRPIYAKETAKRKKYSGLRLLEDSRFELDYEFVYKILENRSIINYSIDNIRLKDLRRKWIEKKVYSLAECSPYKYLQGNKAGYEDYCKLNSKFSDFNMSQKRFDELISSVKKSYNSQKMPVINKDNVILDGQHRASILLYLFGENYEIPVLRLFY